MLSLYIIFVCIYKPLAWFLEAVDMIVTVWSCVPSVHL